jgi:bla regulator protein BlaR1
MIAWLTDTLIYTGLLIGLVLVLRGPVARNFGPQMAYALWALPLLRFIMPPIVLPSSLAPVAAVPESTADWSTPLPASAEVLTPSEAMLAGVRPTDALAPPPPVEVITPPPAPVATDFGWWFDASLVFDVVFSVWLVGAVVFLGWRCWTYHEMRKELLAGSRPVGEVGKVRLVETPAVSGPIAFGVADKVIALPMDFMAWDDRQARDFAIEHELAHHRGGDLLANMLAQPVLALHWFNPLAWLGWSAMRRDQEAACDARVMEWRAPHERAYYGEVIASFAAGPRLALAAPMACPMGVLGEKSIIHRLRSLNMSEISPRRRLAGRALLTGAALIVPLTASISYAEAQVPPPWPDAPEAPEAPDAPDALDAPEAPDAPDAMYWRGDDGDVDVQVRHVDGKKIVTVIREGEDGEEKKVVRSFVVAPQAARAPRAPQIRLAPQIRMAPKVSRMQFQQMRQNMTEEEWEQKVEEWEKQAEANAAYWEQWSRENAEYWEKWGEEFSAQWEKEWPAMVANMPQVSAGFDFDCDEDGRPVKVERSDRSQPGVQSFVMCREFAENVAANANASARRAIERARHSIARDRSLSEDVRDEVLESLDREIERLSDDT